MTIEITRDDLLSLAEAARANGNSLMLMLKSTDNKRVMLVVTATPKRIRKKSVIAREVAAE